MTNSLRYTEYSKTARESENDLEAAILYLRSALFRLGEHGFSSDTASLLSISDLLNSIRVGTRLTNEDISFQTKNILIPVTDIFVIYLQEDRMAKMIQGMMSEWTGDAHLMTEDSQAEDCYRTARSVYREIEFDEKLYFSNEPEFDNAHFAFIDYLEDKDIDYPYPHSTGDYESRIDFKLELVHQT